MGGAQCDVPCDGVSAPLSPPRARASSSGSRRPSATKRGYPSPTVDGGPTGPPPHRSLRKNNYYTPPHLWPKKGPFYRPFAFLCIHEIGSNFVHGAELLSYSVDINKGTPVTVDGGSIVR